MKPAKTAAVAAKTAANVAAKAANNTAASVSGDDFFEFRIEDNVPLPVTAKPARYFPFEKLKSGQSFLVTKDQRKGLRQSLAAYYVASGEKRTVIMRKQEDESIRVWKK